MATAASRGQLQRSQPLRRPERHAGFDDPVCVVFHASTDANTLLGCTQDNGFGDGVGYDSSSWLNCSRRRWGFNAISPANGTDWYTANPDTGSESLAVNTARAGSTARTTCSSPWSPADRSEVTTVLLLPLHARSPGSYALDHRYVPGVARWSGDQHSGTYTALSNNFDTGGSSSCSGSRSEPGAIAGRGRTEGSERLLESDLRRDRRPGWCYHAGRSHVFATTNAGVTLLADVTGTINPNEFRFQRSLLIPRHHRTNGVCDYHGLSCQPCLQDQQRRHRWTALPPIFRCPGRCGRRRFSHRHRLCGPMWAFSRAATASASWTEVGPAAAAGSLDICPTCQ